MQWFMAIQSGRGFLFGVNWALNHNATIIANKRNHEGKDYGHLARIWLLKNYQKVCVDIGREGFQEINEALTEF
jgi:hypothetical protein